MAREPGILEGRCFGCGYELRGLTIVHRCPKCGFPALRSSILWAVGRCPYDKNRGIPLGMNTRARALAAETLSSLLGYAPEAIRFVLAASRAAKGQKQDDGRRHLGAAAFCMAVAEHATRYFGTPAVARSSLQGWGVRYSRDIGRIVSGLVEAGLMVPSENDAPSDFTDVAPFNAWMAG